MKHWYLVQFKSNAHRLAERNLRRQGFETFLPMQETCRRGASRFVSVLRPLFPGYIFVKIAIEAAPWCKINSTIGVSRIVSLGGNPKPLPLQLISKLMLRCDVSGKVLPPKKLNAGDSIEVLTGPFTNFVATVETIDARQRVWVLMEFMGQSTRMNITPEKVRIAN